MPAGRPRKPTATKVLHGTFRKDRAAKHEPTPEAGMPEMPDHLSKDARLEWDRRASALVSMGVLTTIDGVSFGVYCQAVADLAEAERELAKPGGKVISAPSGYPVPSPWLAIRNEAVKQLAKFGGEFGIGAASRGRMNVEPPKVKPRNEWDELEA